VKDEAGPRLRHLLGNMLPPHATEPAHGETRHVEEAAAPLTREQLDQVHAIALETASRLKMSSQRATILADAVVGSLAR
jgi:hypothetical protein